MKNRLSLILGCSVLLSVCVGAPAQSAGDASATRDLDVARSLSRAFNRAASSIQPSVVHITPIRTVYYRETFFGPIQSRQAPAGAGSGVVVSPDGFILTNNHVIDGAERVSIKLADGRELEGRVIGVDPPTDLGVVKVEATGLTPAAFGDSEALEIGEWVIAVGSPFGVFDNTVTSGIVSAKGRIGLQSASDERNEDYIQTDAAVNPGNSGGPLVNLEGKVVGINSQIATRSGGYQGISFAIPATIARAVMEQLVQNGRVSRGWIGVTLDPLTPQAASLAGVRSAEGVVVRQVAPGGPAERADVRPGDVVVRFNDRPVSAVNRLVNEIAFARPGTTSKVDVLRDGQTVRLSVDVADRDGNREGDRSRRAYGFTVRTLPEQAVRRIGFRGVRVESVDRGGPAAGAEVPLEVGDIIVRVNGRPTPDAASFDRVIVEAGGARLRLDVQRGYDRGYIDIEARK